MFVTSVQPSSMEIQGHPSSERAEGRSERVAAAALILVAVGHRHDRNHLAPGGQVGRGVRAGHRRCSRVRRPPPCFGGREIPDRGTGSEPALRMDGHLTVVGVVMAVVTLVGLVATSTLSWWSADPCQP